MVDVQPEYLASEIVLSKRPKEHADRPEPASTACVESHKPSGEWHGHQKDLQPLTLQPKNTPKARGGNYNAHHNPSAKVQDEMADEDSPTSCPHRSDKGKGRNKSGRVAQASWGATLKGAFAAGGKKGSVKFADDSPHDRTSPRNSTSWWLPQKWTRRLSTKFRGGGGSPSSQNATPQHEPPAEAPREVTMRPNGKFADSTPNGKQLTVVRPEILEFQQNKDVTLEHVTGDTANPNARKMMVYPAAMRINVNIRHCESMHFDVVGKSNKIAIVDCNDVTVEMDKCVSQVEIVRCAKLTLVVRSWAPTIQIENCTKITIDLRSRRARRAKFVTAHTQECNLIYRKRDMAEGAVLKKAGSFSETDEEAEERPKGVMEHEEYVQVDQHVPEQFVHNLIGSGKLNTNISELYEW